MFQYVVAPTTVLHMLHLLECTVQQCEVLYCCSSTLFPRQQCSNMLNMLECTAVVCVATTAAVPHCPFTPVLFLCVCGRTTYKNDISMCQKSTGSHCQKLNTLRSVLINNRYYSL